MNSKLFYRTSYSYIKQNNFNSITSLFKLYSTFNRNKLFPYNNYYYTNITMSRNLFSCCFPCVKIQKQNYSTSNDNLISVEVQNQNQIVNSEDTHKKCIFCHLDKERIIYEDDKIIAFHDIKPAAKVHILVIPRAHIVSVKDLTYKDHKELLKCMKIAGIKILKDLGYTNPCLKNENHKISDQNYDGSMSEEDEEDKESPIPSTLLISNKEYDSILGFHIPPFTSVGHLHLHLLGLPFKNWVKSCKYKSIRFPHYFESIDNVIEALKKEDEKEKITVKNENNDINE
ncbi:HIT-like protein [Piromyces finnis]|uniref:HIT-like protein n=1 Tax=Piromyces finnis TaxID=1754191 RepID=A0A1Y1V6E1_9FUNG|nr:HIT-like protein [Piromyces finnis]|eukprot:ORX48389.1 HIT-like protein [Piromyces finnis]